MSWLICCRLLIFLKINNQEQHSVIPDLGLNCYQQMIKVAASKERVKMYICKFVCCLCMLRHISYHLVQHGEILLKIFAQKALLCKV